ncbi:hypothetical protein JCM33374_g4816 [Metschnikowia sp. JCM 33374]|nr:hypothetical protein JCM33374_g4816 [Metschnikowia sp. JCM 33374]
MIPRFFHMAKNTPAVSLRARERLSVTLRHLSASAVVKNTTGKSLTDSPNAPKAEYAAIGIGRKYTKEYQNYCVENSSKIVSYFHDVPLGLDLERNTATMVVEIPRWTNAKFEINTSLPGNPIMQDVKKDKVRFVKNLFPHKGFIFNYGAFPQTWEDPMVMHDVAGLPGDGDPLDVCEIGSDVLSIGDIKTVKILGSLALVDDGELDWKVIVVNVEDPLANEVFDIEDVYEKCPQLLESTREWFRNYKIPDGKLQNKFAFNETYRSQQETIDVILQCHGAWSRLTRGETSAEGFSTTNTSLEKSPGHVKAFEFNDGVLGGSIEPDAEIPSEDNRCHRTAPHRTPVHRDIPKKTAYILDLYHPKKKKTPRPKRPLVHIPNVNSLNLLFVMTSDAHALTQLAVRPFQQTSTWTFSSALALLKSSPEHAASDALDEFLAHNKDVVLSPVPFTAPTTTSKSCPPLEPSKKEFTLRGVLFTGVTPTAVRAALNLASVVHLDQHEALRIVLQTDSRSPAPATGDNSLGRLLFAGSRTADSAIGAGPPHSVVSRSTSSPESSRGLLYAKTALKERRTVLRIASECFNARNLDSASSVVRNLGKSLVVSDSYVLEACTSLASLMDLVTVSSTDPSYESGSAPLENLLHDELLSHMTQLLSLIFDVVLSTSKISPKFASAWFSLMRKTSFGLTLAPYVSSKDSFSVLHGLATIVSLQIFDLPGLNSTHLENPQLFAEISSLICAQSPNNILSYAWLILLYRKSILLEEFPASHESFLSVVPLKSTQTDISKLQQALQSASVFSEIVQLNKILSFDNVFSVVLTDLIIAAIPLIHSTDEIISCISDVFKNAPDASVEKFFDNEDARQLIILARAKFPVSITPYLKLASINGNFALHEFEELSSYMSIFNKTEFSSFYDVDSENTDLVRLTKPVEVFPPFEPAAKLSLLLESETKAKIFTTADEHKLLVTFLHKYNGWAFLGRVLQNISKFFDISQTEKTAALESIVDILVKTTAEDPANVSLVLEYMSTYTDDSDIVDVLFRVFEQSMHNRSVTLSEKILRLFSNLMPVISARIWSYLSTSSLLPNKGKEGFSSILFGTIETVQGDYHFTNSLVKFVFCLADNCLSATKDYSEDSKADILAKFIEHVIQVFENYGSCKFNDSLQKFELGILILDVFTQTLETIYSVGPNLNIDEKPTKVFAKASKKILDAFLASTPGFARSSLSIIDLIDSLASPSVSFDAQDTSGFLGDVWVHSAISFTRLLVTIRSSINAHPSKFEESLFSKLPQLVAIYSNGGPLRKVILDLLTALTSGRWESGKMPSILSHLGHDHSRILLQSLATDLETSFDDYSIKISIYDFLCSIMEANQQGLSVLFISGRNVFGEMSQEKDSKKDTQMTSLLSIMKKNINDVKFYPPTVTVHLLDAISLAFNSWTTARSDDSDVVFVKELVSMLENFTKSLDSKSSRDIILSSYSCKVYAKIAEILSLVLFTTKNEKCVESIQSLLSSNAFIEKLPSYFAISDYEHSLYDHVKTHFGSVFENYQLTDFAVAIKKRNRFGSGMVYDLLLLDAYFQRNPKWNDVREQIIFLSANMQYYNSQISLSKSIGALLATFCRRTPGSVPKEYSKVVNGLLAIKEPKDSYSEPFCSQQYYERIELAFLLLFTVNNTKEGKTEAVRYSIPIIESCSDLMESPDVGYLSSNKDDFSYRSLLRISYIALANVKSDFEIVNTHTQALLKLFDYVVSKGTTSIIIELQNDVYLARTNKNHKPVNLGGRLDDLRLILSVLKVFVQLDITTSLQGEFSSSLIKHNTVDTLLSLYSFSHLILVNNEPIFAQLSLMFIQQLLLVEDFAEKMVNSKMFMVMRETISENVVTLRAFSKQIEYCIESWSNDSSALRVSSAGTFETMQLLYIFQILMSIASAQGITANSPTDVDMPVLPGLDTQQKRDDFVGFVSNLLKHPKFLKSRVYPSSMEEEALMKADGNEYETFVKGLIEDIKELKEFLV